MPDLHIIHPYHTVKKKSKFEYVRRHTSTILRGRGAIFRKTRHRKEKLFVGNGGFSSIDLYALYIVYSLLKI